ncbi:Transmembrane protein 131 [Schistosoma japonicum]|nr:Transmembrane protein 131 [Schistosoma japonicum]
MPGTRVINNIHLLGTILIGQTCNHSITIFNKNPIPIELKSIGIYTIPDDGTKCPFIKTRFGDCYLSGPCEKCTLNSIEMKSLSKLTIPFSWGSVDVAQHVKGFVQIHSKYETTEQQFEYFVTRGLITVTPDPLIVNNLFPHNIVVQNAYPSDINITNINLHSVMMSSNNFDNVLSFDAVQFYKIQQNATLDNMDSPNSLQPIHFTVNESRVVGMVYFDLSKSCIDIYEDINQYATMLTNVTTSAVTNEIGINHVPGSNKSLETVKPYCYCGFSLNTSSGMLWLKGVTETVNQYNHETSYQSSINHLLLKETFRLYSELYSQWLKHSRSKDFPKNSPVTTTTTVNKPSFNSTYVVNTLSYELSNESTTYYSDLSVQFIWPHIINTTKVSFNQSKDNLTFCTIKIVPYSKLTSVNRSLPTQHLLQMPTSSSSKSTNSFECILQIINPQSTINPLFIQPVLWNQLFKDYATNAEKLNHLKEFTTNISADPAFVESLFTTDYGTFSIQPIFHSQSESRTSQKFVDSLYPPGYILPSNGGEQYFRLIFRPYENLFELLREKKTIDKSTIRGLLLIRNNLTSIEPLWLEIHFGHISLTLGKLSTPSVSSSSTLKFEESLHAFINDFRNQKPVPKHTNSPTFNVHVRDAPNSRLLSSSVSNLFAELQNNQGPLLKNDQILSNVELDFSSLFNNYNNNTIHQKIQNDLTLKLEFTEKNIGPLCKLYDTEQVHHLPPPLQSKDSKQSVDTHHHIDFRKDLLSTLSLRRRLILLNTGQITLTIFMLCFLPSDNDKQKSTGNIPISNHSSFLSASCNAAGFKLDPCILPSDTYSKIIMNTNPYVVHNNSSNAVTLLPGQQLIIELRHNPDFTHTYLTTNLTIKLYPTLFQSTVIQWWNSKQLNETNDHVLLINLPQIPLEATFDSRTLSTCLSLLPRPPIESFLWIMVILFYLLNITAVLVVSYGDAKEIYTSQIALRRYINELPKNVYPDSTKQFNLNQPNDKSCVSCTNTKHVCNPSHTILTTTSNSQLSSSSTLIKNHLINNTNLETNEISTTVSGSKIKWKDKANHYEQMKSKRTLLSTKSFFVNYFQWILGLFFVIKYISVRWILMITTYPYKAMKRHIICMMKLRDCLNFHSIYHCYDYIRCFCHSTSNRINNNQPGDKSNSSLNSQLSNGTMVVNRRNLFGFSKQSSNEEVKNQKISSKSLSKNLAKLTNQPLDKTTGTRVNRKKKTANSLVEISKPSESNVNGSEDHSRSRLTKVEPLSSQPPLTTTPTPTSTIVSPITGNKDVSPPRMAEADIVAAVQASIRLTEDVGNHHETRRKQSQRISSLTKCHNSASLSPVSGPDVEDNSNVSNKSTHNISMFYRNQTVGPPFSLRYKSNPINKMPSLPPVDNKCVVNHQTEKGESKPTAQRMSFTKRCIDDCNDNVTEQSVNSQESLETANRKSVSPLQNSLNNKPNESIVNSHQFSDAFNANESLEWPETIQKCFIPKSTMNHYSINDQYPFVIFPLWNEVGVPESTAYWSQPLMYSDENFFSTDSPEEAMNRLSEDTHTFAQLFITESTDPSPCHSQFISSQFETTHFIQPPHDYEDEFINDYFNQNKFVQNDDTFSNMLDTMKENDNNEDFLFVKNLLEYSYSNDIGEQNSLQFDHCSDFYVNRIAIENALNTTLPIICSLLQSNNSDEATDSNASMTFPTYQDNNLCQIDTSLITQIFLNALDTTHNQYFVETNPSYWSANTDVHIYDDMTIVTNSSTDLSSEEIITDYHINNADNDSIQHIDYNPHGSCKMNFYELSQITETRRLSVLNYEAKMDSFIEEMNVEQEYFDLVPNLVKSMRINSDEMNSTKQSSYSSWKSIVDIPQSELFQELELSETTFEQSTFISSSFINYGNVFKESSAITPWTDILERLVESTNSSINAPLSFQDTCCSSLFTTTIKEDMIG